MATTIGNFTPDSQFSDGQAVASLATISDAFLGHA